MSFTKAQAAAPGASAPGVSRVPHPAVPENPQAQELCRCCWRRCAPPDRHYCAWCSDECTREGCTKSMFHEVSDV